MREFNPRDIFTKSAPAPEVWGPDWTKNFNPNEVIPGTILIDPPYPEIGDRKLRKSDIANAVSRQPLLVDEVDFQELAKRCGILETKLVCFFAAQRFSVHNEGTKFGERFVLLVTPAIINQDRFAGKENLISYFVYEQNLGIAECLPRLFTVEGISPKQLEEIFQQAKTQVMKYALFKGDLAAYLALDLDVASQSILKTQALEEIAREYTPTFFNLSTALLGLLRQPRPDIYKVWQRQMRRKGFSFDYLNESLKN